MRAGEFRIHVGGVAGMIDWTLNIGTIVQILVLAGGALTFVFAVKGDVTKVKENITDIKEELKELRKVFTTQVDHDGRLSRVEKDVRDLRSDIKELRHGEGFVFPLKPVG
jgi:enoyl-[acyl-carrier-protein] reductase (NADH)